MCICISKKLKYLKNEARGIKNWKITYSVILSVLSNKTNLILGFRSPQPVFIYSLSFKARLLGCFFLI